MLTDQVEAQGEKIRDLEFCLEEHREKLNATEEMLRQVGAAVHFPAELFDVLHLYVVLTVMQQEISWHTQSGIF